MSEETKSLLLQCLLGFGIPFLLVGALFLGVYLQANTPPPELTPTPTVTWWEANCPPKHSDFPSDYHYYRMLEECDQYWDWQWEKWDSQLSP